MRRGQNAGFTLIEILISIAIFTLIFSYIFSVMTTTLDTGKMVEEKMDLDQIGRFTIKRITHDLLSATTLPLSGRGRFVGRSAVYSGFSMDEFHFTAFTRLHFGNRPRLDQSEIGYFFNRGDAESIEFMRRESDSIKDQVDKGGIAFAITTHVKELKIRYLGKKEYQGWLENWNSEDTATAGFPKAVSIELILTDGKRENFYSTVVVLEEYGKV